MPDGRRTYPPPRARPVPDLPGDALLAHAEDLARRWAIALIRARPLEDLADIPFADLGRDAPSLCAQALRALQSDVELDRLTGIGVPGSRADSAAARDLAVIAGAASPAAAVAAVEALRGVLWEALLDHLHEPSARQVGDLADRLAYVCAEVLAAAVDAAFALGADVPVAEPGAREREPAAPRGRDAVIVDERAGGPPGREPARPRAAPAGSRPGRWPISDRSAASLAPEIEIRDARDDRPRAMPAGSGPGPDGVERGEEGPAAWIGSIGARLEQFKRDGLPFAVLLVELVDVERLRREQLPVELSALAGRMERALVAELGSASGSLTRERPGRCWLLMPETDHDRARELVERLTCALASGASDRATPMDVAIGVAVCPQDGREAAALAAHADVGLYAARAALRASAGEHAAGRSGA